MSLDATDDTQPEPRAAALRATFQTASGDDVVESPPHVAGTIAGLAWTYRNVHETEQVVRKLLDEEIHSDHKRDPSVYLSLAHMVNDVSYKRELRMRCDAMLSRQLSLVDFSHESNDLVDLLSRDDLTRTVRQLETAQEWHARERAAGISNTSGQSLRLARTMEPIDAFCARFGPMFRVLAERALTTWLAIASTTDVDYGRLDAAGAAWLNDITSVTQAPDTARNRDGNALRTLITYKNGFSLLPRTLEEHARAHIGNETEVVGGLIERRTTGLFDSPHLRDLACDYVLGGLTRATIGPWINALVERTLERVNVSVVLAAQSDHGPTRALEAVIVHDTVPPTESSVGAPSVIVSYGHVDAAVRQLLTGSTELQSLVNAMAELTKDKAFDSKNPLDVLRAWVVALTASYAIYGMMGREVDPRSTWNRITAWAAANQAPLAPQLVLADAAPSAHPLTRLQYACENARLALACVLARSTSVDRHRAFAHHVLVDGFMLDGPGAPMRANAADAESARKQRQSMQARISAIAANQSTLEGRTSAGWEDKAKRHKTGLYFEQNTMAIRIMTIQMHRQADEKIRMYTDGEMARKMADDEAARQQQAVDAEENY